MMSGMKKFLAAFGISLTALSLNACSSKETPESTDSAGNNAASTLGDPESGANQSSGTTPGDEKTGKQDASEDKSNAGKPNPTPGANTAEEKSNDSRSSNQRPPRGGSSNGGGNHTITRGQVGGDCGTTDQGDFITAGYNTSCEMAAATYDAAIKAHFVMTSPDPTVTAIPKTNVVVTSPATGQSYNLKCIIGSDGRNMLCGNPPAGANAKKSDQVYVNISSEGARSPIRSRVYIAE